MEQSLTIFLAHVLEEVAEHEADGCPSPAQIKRQVRILNPGEKK